MKCCTKCGVEYPATAEYFYKGRECRNGLRAQCKSCVKEATDRWRAANPERVRAFSKAWIEANPERKKASRRAWREANSEHALAIEKAWRKAHPERTRETGRTCSSRRRARKRDAGGTFKAGDVRKLYELQKGRCWWNAKHKLDKGYHIDHRVALARGGSNDISNIVLACPKCNLSKQAKTPDEFIGRLL